MAGAMVLALLLALQVGASVPPEAPTVRRPLPTPPPTGENPRNPVSRTVLTTYACTDGTRSFVVQYEQIPTGRITSLSRNGKAAAPRLVDQVNALLKPFNLISSIYPQCGSRQDSLFVTGLVDKQQTTVWIVWSLDNANLVTGDVPATKPPRPASGDIQVDIVEPARPKRGVVTRSGFCGRDRYVTELRDAGTGGGGALLLARVNGKRVAAGELNRALALVPEGLFLYETRVAECSRSARQARVRLMAAGPASMKPLWISFLLSAEGRVTGERLD